jgi:aminobenzoyl-glutamate utilization protein B
MRNDPLNLEALSKRIGAKAHSYAALADEVQGCRELRFAEHLSAAVQISQLEAEGFRFTREVAGLPTAFMAESGTSGPVIGFTAQFDALARLSQDPSSLSVSILQPGASGYGCGHNLPGAGAMLAAVGTRDNLAAAGQPGTIRYYGCPGEKSGPGKTFMAMAATGLDAIRDPEWLAHARAELRRRAGDKPYACPIPPEIVAPPLRHLIKEPA